MPIVYTVPVRIHPIIAWVFRICTMLICLGAIVFTVIGIIRAERSLRKPAHPMQRLRPEIVPYK